MDSLYFAALCIPFEPGYSKWVQAPCPFAHWRHSGGIDNNPSYYINAEGTLGSHCFTCGWKGNALDLVMDLRRLNKQDPSGLDYDFGTAYKLALAEDKPDELQFKDYGDKKKSTAPVPFPEDWWATFPTAAHHPYLKERGLDVNDAVSLDIRFDAGRDRIVFPLRGFDGRLYGAYGRDASKGQNQLRYHSYDHAGVRNPVVWGGESDCNLAKPVVLTEGMFDYAKICKGKGDKNVLWSHTTQINPAMFARIASAPLVITMYDHGTGGDVARGLVEKFFGSTCTQHVVPEDDAGAMTPDEVVDALSAVVF